MCNLTNPTFTDETKAREHLEAIRWPDGPYCPHCGEVENVKRLEGKSHRPGLLYCRSCRKKFSVTVGTVFERSHIPLHKWLLAAHLMASSKKGISAHQLHRMLDITYKSAWFMAHRLREAAVDDTPTGMGGDGGAVEVDETFIGRNENKKDRHRKDGRGPKFKNAVLTLVDRDSSRSRSVVIKDLTANTIYPIVRANVYREAQLMTDDARHYKTLGREFASHGVVRHNMGEYVKRHNKAIHTQTIEGFFSIFKRGMKGIYQYCGTQHLHRYLAEYDFRYSNRAALDIDDNQRAAKLLAGITGKRLTYRRTNEAHYA
jgi:transposase-like protein